ncbi:MAG: glyoxalase/bleomycin resistance/dioxygenase family protein, partial [Meiothermus sp.]|nr:glyoxalase/bleomycin resistance/dioxygenase family protein [Meiothermus sp.]
MVSRVWLGFPDIERAVEAYAHLGFWVVRRRQDRAQIFLADGVVLELFSLAHLPLNQACGLGEGGELLKRRRRFYEGRTGLLDYVLSPTASPMQFLAQLEQRDIPYKVVGTRLLPQMVLCPPPLPLWLEPPTPLPAPEQTQHPNGVTGLHALVVGSPAYPAALAQHRRLLGPPLAFEAYEGRRRAVFAI